MIPRTPVDVTVTNKVKSLSSIVSLVYSEVEVSVWMVVVAELVVVGSGCCVGSGSEGGPVIGS
jgi:hypothetical protein